MQAAIFDRDGVINIESGYVRREADFILAPRVGELFGRLVADGIPIFVITNQGGVGLGLYDRKLLEKLHAPLFSMGVTELFFCPHHPLTGRCLCRKPESLFYERIAARYGLTRATMVGDRVRDLTPARKLGWATARLGKAHTEDPAFEPDFSFSDLAELADNYSAVFGKN